MQHVTIFEMNTRKVVGILERRINKTNHENYNFNKWDVSNKKPIILYKNILCSLQESLNYDVFICRMRIFL